MEASGHARWLERLLAELQLERWIGDAAEIRTQRVRKQKTDRQDAQLILQLLLEDGFPRIWVPSWENRDITSTILWRRFLRSTEVPVTEPQKFRFGNRIESPLQIFPLRQPPTAGECKRQPKRT